MLSGGVVTLLHGLGNALSTRTAHGFLRITRACAAGRDPTIREIGTEIFSQIVPFAAMVPIWHRTLAACDH